MGKNKVKSILFLLLGITLSSVLPTSAATVNVDTFNGTNPLYKNNFASGTTLNITADIKASSDIGTYLGAKTLTFNGNGKALSGSTTSSPAQLGFVVQSGGGDYTFNTVTLKLFSSATDATKGGALTVSGTAALNNVTIDSNTSANYGGAIYNNGGITTIKNSTIINNSATTYGGAIYNESGTINIGSSGSNTDTTLFTNNYTNDSTGEGGAIYNKGTLHSYGGVTFTGNYGTTYGAIYNYPGATATFDHNTFSYNGFDDYNGSTANNVVSTYAGAINTDGIITITNSTFDHNAATTVGGAIGNSGTLTIGTLGGTDNTSFISNYLKGIDWKPGGAIYNDHVLNIYNGVSFAGNYTLDVGGAIYNNGTMAIDGATFKYNGFSDYDSVVHTVSTGSGGAIFNDSNSSTTITTSVFNNNAATYAGAIQNNGILNSSGNTYAGNFSLADCGAIYNNQNATFTSIGDTFKYNGFRDYNGTNAETIVTQNGGAIYNEADGVVQITNSSFTNNSVTTDGGAIYNSANGRIYIQSDGVGNQTLFQNNTANSTSNAIHQAGNSSNSSRIYFNSGDSGVITSQDSITGSNTAYNNIYINSSDATASTSFINPAKTLTSGNVNLYGNITGNTIYNYSGTTYFGQSGTSNSGFYNGTAFNLLGGTQYFYNGISGATISASDGIQNVYSSLANSTLSLSNSATFNLASTGAITGSTLNINGGTFNLASGGTISSSALNLNSGNFNIANNSIETIALTNFTANPAATLTFDADLSNGTSDRLTISGSATGTLNATVNILKDSPTAGSLTLTLMSGSNISGLTLNDIATTYTTYGKYTFTGSKNGTYSVAMDWAEGLNSAVAINTLSTRSFSATADSSVTKALGTMGANNSSLYVNGNNHNINGLGFSGVNVLGGQSIIIADANSWNGFHSNNGGAINNSGTTTITNSNFRNNTAVTNGGVIYNNGRLDISESSSFISNTAQNGDGGVIHNDTNATANISNSTFTNNVSTNLGGAIYNLGTLNITGGTFNANNAVNYGGAICNEGDAAISNASFFNNTTYNNGGAIATNFGTLNVSSSLFDSNGSYSSGGALFINRNQNIENISTSTFTNNYASDDGGALANWSGQIAINSSTFKGNYTTNSGDWSGLGGAIFNASNGTLSYLYIKNSTFEGNGIQNYGSTDAQNPATTITQYGGAIENMGWDLSLISNLTVINSTFTGNKATRLGGAIHNQYGILNIIADGGNTSFSGNTDAGGLNDIYLDTNSTLNLNAGNGGKITFGGGIKSNSNDNIININKSMTYNDGVNTKTAPTDGQIVLNGPISGATDSIDPSHTISNINPTVNFYSGTLSLSNDSYLNGSNLVLASDTQNSIRTLNLINNNVGTMALNSLALNANSNLKIDVNLANGTADKITSASGITGSGKLNINGINLLNDSTTNKTTANLTTDPTMASHITLGLDKAYTPMYQYNVAYDGSGNLTFVNPGVSDYTKFNPTVLSSQISTSVGAYMNQVNIYNEVLSRADVFMSLPQTERLLMRYRNMYANVGGNDVQPEVFSPTYLPDENAGLWVKQYTTFENIPLNNGPNVSNVGYGAIVGGDTPMQHLGHGMDGYLTFYAGYNGSHQNYDSVGVNQNGGALGVTGTLYKGNLFTTMTASTGDSYGQANTPYGVDNFNTLLAGLAWKTGYNFEIDRGKFILQPSFLTAYTFAKTFDYQTASGVNVTSDPLNALQLAPGLKFIYNGHKGWQPYLTTNMIWNLMDVQKFYANDAQLPQMSIAPYFEYGAGVQRRWGERFTGFGQALLRGGGRNGLSLQFGFRYALGK